MQVRTFRRSAGARFHCGVLMGLVHQTNLTPVSPIAAEWIGEMQNEPEAPRRKLVEITADLLEPVIDALN